MVPAIAQQQRPDIGARLFQLAYTRGNGQHRSLGHRIPMETVTEAVNGGIVQTPQNSHAGCSGWWGTVSYSRTSTPWPTKGCSPPSVATKSKV
jgi:hypothetical protein